MASSPITSWKIEGKQQKQWHFIFLGSEINADSDCSHEIKRQKKKSYDQPRQQIRKQRHHFAHKGPYSQSYGFSSSHVWMWEMDHKEGWALKNWCFWTVVRRRLLRVPWTARRSNQSILNDISPEYSLEGLKLKLQYCDHLMWRADSLEKTLMLGKIRARGKEGAEDDRFDIKSISMDTSLGKHREIVKAKGAWHEESDVTQRLNNNFGGGSCMWLEIHTAEYILGSCSALGFRLGQVFQPRHYRPLGPGVLCEICLCSGGCWAACLASSHWIPLDPTRSHFPSCDIPKCLQMLQMFLGNKINSSSTWISAQGHWDTGEGASVMAQTESHCRKKGKGTVCTSSCYRLLSMWVHVCPSKMN